MLSIQKVSKNFGGLKALKEVSFQVEKGLIHGIIGPNGSGKTTLFNCISGLIPVSSGEIHLDGKKISGLPGNEIAGLGLRRTFQAGKLIPNLTVLENVMCGISSGKSGSEDYIKNRAMEALDITGIKDTADRWASDLVWAERQLVQIARTLVSRPEIILLDEPASGMGPNETGAVGELIKKIKGTGITVVVVSHDMRMLMNTAEQVTVLNFGEKIYEGKPEDVRSDPQVLEAYLGRE